MLVFGWFTYIIHFLSIFHNLLRETSIVLATHVSLAALTGVLCRPASLHDTAQCLCTACCPLYRHVVQFSVLYGLCFIKSWTKIFCAHAVLLSAPFHLCLQCQILAFGRAARRRIV